ncbi:MAG: hypothetical protein GY854_02125 [Deltaproteobacteria bacterium]|nr:hypothetical protein [Deltaproteobacteria bacterium]
MMPVDTNDKLDLDLSNQPASMRSNGLSGPRKYIKAEERKQRRIDIDRALIIGRSNADIETDMHSKYGMTPAAVKILIDKRLETMAKESSHRKPYRKATAERRLAEHIEEAVGDRSWGAVANLEKVRASIEGTIEEPGQGPAISQERLTEAVAQIVQGLDPERFKILVERERILIARTESAAESKQPDILDTKQPDSASVPALQPAITIETEKDQV